MADITAFPIQTTPVSQLPSITADAVTGAIQFVVNDPANTTESGVGTTSKVSRTALNQAGSVFNVKDFGAMGNGIADDTASIQACVDAASVAHGIVFVPDGVYFLYGTITIPDYAVLVGASRQGVQFSLRAGGLPAFDVASVYHLSAFRITDGSGAASTTGILIGGPNFPLASQGTMDNVEIGGFSGAGSIGLDYRGVSCYFQAVYSHGNTYNLRLGGGNVPTASLFAKCDFRQSLEASVFIESGYLIKFQSCLIESNEKYAVLIQHVGGGNDIYNIDFDTTWTENNWASLAGNPTRETSYEVRIDVPVGKPTKSVTFRNGTFNNGTNRPLSVWASNTQNTILDNNSLTVTGSAATYKFDGAGTSVARVLNWDAAQYGNASSVVSDALHVVSCDSRAAPFTPTLVGAWTSTNIAATGNYVRVGNTVEFTISLVTTTGNIACTGGATAYVSGLPLAPSSDSVGDFVTIDGLQAGAVVVAVTTGFVSMVNAVTTTASNIVITGRYMVV